jgi:lambda repressor-like predicted transcriptional regulator
MHPADIKAAIEKAGITQAELARTMKGRSVSAGAVWAVINGQSKSAEIAQHIARTLGKAVHDLWPGKYPQLQHRGHRAARRG